MSLSSLSGRMEAFLESGGSIWDTGVGEKIIGAQLQFESFNHGDRQSQCQSQRDP